MKKVGSVVRRELLSYLETKDIYELANIDEMGEQLQQKLRKGQELLYHFTQYKYSPMEADEMVTTFKDIIR